MEIEMDRKSQKLFEDYSLYVEEKNRKTPVSSDELEKMMNLAFNITGKEGGDISLVVCDNDFIAKLNKKYKGRIGPTNVLSFSMREGEFSELNKDALPLGDIVISMDKVKEEAEKFGDTVDIVFKHLFIHGVLHLLGYTHNNDDEEEKMNELTERIVMGV
ncbi:MAG: rRNA maturation RNase YbeY [Spirochaetes bacterium]|nr:MAG: rRNA maturation RNase YbeY [Spirochaetota bacterium]